MAGDYFYGISDIRMIWHGEWADRELIWHGKSFDYYDLEDPLWSIYTEQCEEAGIPTSDEKFAEWVRQNTDYVFEILQNLEEDDQTLE